MRYVYVPASGGSTCMHGGERGEDEASIRIELCRENGEIRVRRTTALGTFTRLIDR